MRNLEEIEALFAAISERSPQELTAEIGKLIDTLKPWQALFGLNAKLFRAEASEAAPMMSLVGMGLLTSGMASELRAFEQRLFSICVLIVLIRRASRIETLESLITAVYLPHVCCTCMLPSFFCAST